MSLPIVGKLACTCCGEYADLITIDLNGVPFWKGCKLCAQRLPVLIEIVADALRKRGLTKKTLDILSRG